MAATRRAYTGAAVSTTTSSSIAASGTTSFTITAYTGWPYGTDPFYIVVEPGTASEEKILVTRTGSTDTTINVASDSERGQDGTSAVLHSTGSTVFPVFTSVDADEANAVASVITADTTNSRIGIGTGTPEKELHIVKDQNGDLTQVLIENLDQRVRVGSYYELGVGQYAKIQSENDGGSDLALVLNPEGGNVGIGNVSPSYTLDVTGDINATGNLRIGGTAIGTWTSFSPAWTNLTVGNGVQFFYYCVIGDIMLITGAWQLGSTSSIGTSPYFTIPGGYSITGDAVGASKHWDVTFGVFSGYCDTYAPSSLVQPGAFATSGSFVTPSTITATVPFTWAAGDVMYLSIYMRVS